MQAQTEEVFIALNQLLTVLNERKLDIFHKIKMGETSYETIHTQDPV